MGGLSQKEERAAEPETPAPARFFNRPKLQSPNEALQPEMPPPPPTPRRRRPALSALSGLFSFVLIAAVVGLFGVVWGAHRLQEPGPLPADKVLFIAPGTDLPDIIATLEQEQVIDSPLIFNLALLVEGDRSRVRAGEYLFRQSASMHQVMDTLVNGKQILHSVTVPEGLTSEQIVERLRGNDLLLGDIREVPKEGTLLPETYKVPRGMARADLIHRMQEDQNRLVAQIWAKRARNLPLHSPYELVTLASIVEKETGKAEERPLVAAVFLNRLQKRMRLQSDPTVVYGLVGGKGTLGHPIQKTEVEGASPYNTYMIDGLPPGPITNPGRASLEAVANPAHTQDLYFVADGTGGHVFSTTLEQHQRNVARWRQMEKDKSAVDKYIPQPPPRPDQRGEIGGSAYGALPALYGVAESPPLLGVGSAAAAVAAIAPKMPNAASTSGSAADSVVAAAQPQSGIAVGPGLDDLGISVRGVGSARAAADLLDGPIDASGTPESGQAIAASRGSETVPAPQATPSAPSAPQATPSAPSAPQATPSAPQATPSAPQAMPSAPQGALSAAQKQGRGPSVTDVSEGTSLDPLRNTTYDLNYAKDVPSAADAK